MVAGPEPEGAHTLIGLARRYVECGWSPATSGNYSLRIDADRCLMTASGANKAALTDADLLCMGLDGAFDKAQAARPSAESALHLMLYRRSPEIGAVLHTHSPAGTVLSRLLVSTSVVGLIDYELLKAFAGMTTHAAQVAVPIVDNDQDVDRLARAVARALDATSGPCYGFLIRGHGLYAWGATVADAARHVEAFEYLLRCELDALRVQPRT